MAETPPPYGTAEYWDERFKVHTESYDWLEKPSILDADIVAALDAHDHNVCKPRILHIGSGTSMLSIHLRRFVQDPSQVQHIDFSTEAIEWGRRLEKSTFGFEWGEDGVETEQLEGYGLAAENLKLDIPMMTWTQTSLLSLESVISTCSLGAYRIIVDKSCCDAIACASWVKVPVPFFFYLGPSGKMPASADTKPQTVYGDDEYSIHPVNLLAIHLALVTPPGARWIALSFSEDRWPFFRDPDRPEAHHAHQALPKDLLDSGFPDPAKLWSLIKKERIVDETSNDKVDEPSASSSQRTSQHWIYVLQRTNVELKIRGT